MLKRLKLEVCAWNDSDKQWETEISEVKKIGNIWACHKSNINRLIDIKI